MPKSRAYPFAEQRRFVAVYDFRSGFFGNLPGLIVAIVSNNNQSIIGLELGFQPSQGFLDNESLIMGRHQNGGAYRFRTDIPCRRGRKIGGKDLRQKNRCEQ